MEFLTVTERSKAMVTKRSIAELKRNITKESVSFSRMRGCYVNNEKEKVTEVNTKFLTLPEEELYKYLDIAQEIFKGKPDEKIITLEFHPQADTADRLLQELVDTGLENDAAVEELYDRIIEHYGTIGNYLILLYNDDYDVITETANREKLDESELVYSYIICAICPVTLTKAGLECCEHKIQPRERDWVVQKPDIGFVYPAFEDREPVLNHIMYYASSPKEPQHSVMEATLETVENMLAAEHKQTFEDGFEIALQSEELTEQYLNAVSAQLQIRVDGDTDEEEKQARIDDVTLRRMLEEVKMDKFYIEKIIKDFKTRYQYIKWPKAKWLYAKNRAAKHYDKNKKNRMRELLSRSSTELLKLGQSDLADEIEEYLERTK